MTFDQNGPKCRFGTFEFLTANLPNWRFWRNKSVIGTIGQRVKARIFRCFKFLKFRSMTSYFWETSETAILAENWKKNTRTLVAIAKTTKISVKKTTTNCKSSRDRSELQLLCRYNSCKTVANNGEGWKTSLPEGE